MSDTPSPQPKPRWRPRFSLRTLMIGVLFLGFSLTATQVWGVPRICEKYGAALEDGHMLFPFIVQVNFHKADGIDDYECWFWFFTIECRLGGRQS